MLDKVFDGFYYINLDKYVSFFADLKASEKEKNTVITMNYGDDNNGYNDEKDVTLLSKEVIESKVNTNSQTQSLRFETLKMFMDILFETYYNEEGHPFVSQGQVLAFNTLVKAGILVKAEEE